MCLTNAEKAYRQIKEKIITLEMEPGYIIRETRLMEELGLGRTPVREALKQLQAENLVVVAPHRGLFVADIAITDLQQIYEVRVELESLCARLATERTTPEAFGQMKDLLAEYEQGDKKDQKRLIDLDRRFHTMLAETTGNKFLCYEFEKFYNLSLRIWHLALYQIQPAGVDIEAHIEIVAAIEAQDSAKAEQRMREHIQHFHDTVKQYL